MTIKDWKSREFSGSGWDNRTIKKLIADGKLVGILNGRHTLVREDQTLSMLAPYHNEVNELIRLSA